MRTLISRSLIAASLFLGPLAAGAQGTLLTGSFGGTQATAFSCAVSSCIAMPQQVGTNGYNVTVSSPSSNARIGNAELGSHGFTTNGWWATGMYAAPNNSSIGNGLRFTFTQPVYAVGAWMNYANDVVGGYNFGPAYLRAYGADNVLLNEFDLRALAPILTTGSVNASAFRGIENMLGIYAFEIAGSFIATRDLYVASTPSFRDGDADRNPAVLLVQDPPVTTTPEPSTYALMAAGLAAVGAVARRRRA